MTLYRTLLREDFYAWCNFLKYSNSFLSFIIIFIKFPEFRKVIDFRLKQSGSMVRILRVFTYFSSKHINLYISDYNGKAKIDGGLVFQHGFSTIVFCERIGKNCRINQQVTIGSAEGTGIPKIGNNVRICAGAKVLGNITIGDDVIIGANAVVIKDIPSHSIVAGVPAKIIKMRRNEEECWFRIEVN